MVHTCAHFHLLVLLSEVLKEDKVLIKCAEINSVASSEMWDLVQM